MIPRTRHLRELTGLLKDYPVVGIVAEPIKQLI